MITTRAPDGANKALLVLGCTKEFQPQTAITPEHPLSNESGISGHFRAFLGHFRGVPGKPHCTSVSKNMSPGIGDTGVGGGTKNELVQANFVNIIFRHFS